MFNSLLSERLAVVATIDPGDKATSAATSDYVDMSKFDKIMAVLLGGAITGTLDAKLVQATSAAGANVKDITGKAITTIADTADNVQAIINLRSDQIDIEGGFKFVALVVTPTGGSTNLAGAVILASDAKHNPASDNDLASVAEIIG